MKVFQISVFEDHERLSRRAAKWLKQAAVSRFVAGAISPDSPSTYLRTRDGVSIMLTRDCAPFRNRLSNDIDTTPSLSAVA